MTAALVDVPAQRVLRWSHATAAGSPALIHTVGGHGRFTVPLVGIAEAAGAAALAKAKLPPTAIRRAATFIRDRYGDEYAFANREFFISGCDVLSRDEHGFFRWRDAQGAFDQVLEQELRRLVVGPDGVVEAVRVDRFGDEVEVTVDPLYNSGAMSYVNSRVPVYTVLDAFADHWSDAEIASEYGVAVKAVARTRELKGWLERVAY
jgi:uncharacterized protein (DUF433 family)